MKTSAKHFGLAVKH